MTKLSFRPASVTASPREAARDELTFRIERLAAAADRFGEDHDGHSARILRAAAAELAVAVEGDIAATAAEWERPARRAAWRGRGS